jgi:hypothetical protein
MTESLPKFTVTSLRCATKCHALAHTIIDGHALCATHTELWRQYRADPAGHNPSTEFAAYTNWLNNHTEASHV